MRKHLVLAALASCAAPACARSVLGLPVYLRSFVKQVNDTLNVALTDTLHSGGGSEAAFSSALMEIETLTEIIDSDRYEMEMHSEAAQYATNDYEYTREKRRAYEALSMLQKDEDALWLLLEMQNMTLVEKFKQTFHPAVIQQAVSVFGPTALDGAAIAVKGARAHIRSVVDTVFSDYPLLATFFEWFSICLPLFLLGGFFYYFRQGAAEHSSITSELLLLSHIYWALYYGIVGLFSLPGRYPPLVAFAYDQPDQYVAYQVSSQDQNQKRP